jgi:hypothetical protein
MDGQPPEFASTIARYSREAPKERRLAQGPSLLEALRTRELIERHAPAAPATVLDIGGAAGAYAFWLAEGGYTVHLLDPVSRLVAKRSDGAPTIPGRLFPVSSRTSAGEWQMHAVGPSAHTCW